MAVMTIDPNPNDPCPCGSGKKYKKCCMKRKPRKWSVTTHFQKPITTLGIGHLSDGTVQFFDDGVPVKDAKVEYKTIYDRKRKKKVINKIDLIQHQNAVDPDALLLQKFDLIYAIDTNTKNINGTLISVASVILCMLNLVTDDTFDIQYGHLQSLEFWNIKNHPENIAWMKAIQFITQDPANNPDRKIGIIVDSDLANLSAYNTGTLPIYSDFYLPKNFELIFASADAGTQEFLANHLISLCHKLAGSLLMKISLDTIPDKHPEEVKNEPYTHFRRWNFSGNLY
jgi:SEC-C motif-containing protein